jgi:heptosyltransferase III
MGLRAGVFCHNGLGDGVNSLVLSNNLQLNGWKVDTYNNTLPSMQNWFPHLPVKPYPPLSELPVYDRYFVVWNDTDPFTLELIRTLKRTAPEKIHVIYLVVSKNIKNEPYYSDCLTDPRLPVAENMRLFAERILHLPKITKSNGFIAPLGLTHRKYKKRIVIHATSARESRNWPIEKFLKLTNHLKEEGFEPVFVPEFPTLDELASFIYESGYLIGNDSGLGHLASALQVPTLTFSRKKSWAAFWRPSFGYGIVLAPPNWIPNMWPYRLRDRHWKSFVTVAMARRGFERLLNSEMTGAKS